VLRDLPKIEGIQGKRFESNRYSSPIQRKFNPSETVSKMDDFEFNSLFGKLLEDEEGCTGLQNTARDKHNILDNSQN
jgi:hypothetical protein